MKKVFLTGGSGFIGKNITESYLAQKYEICAPSRAELDIADTQSVDNFFRNRTFDAVIHCAAKPGHRNAKNKDKLLYTNLRIFVNLERHRDKYEKFIHCGSGAIYDNGTDISNVSENDLFKRIGAEEISFYNYLIAKQVQSLSQFVVLNIFGIFGKYEDYEIRFISNAICKALFDLPITLRQNRRFSYIYVDDLYQILEFFIENDAIHKFYNVSSDSYVTLYDLAVLVKKISEKYVPIHVAKDGFGLDYYGNNQRLHLEMPNLCFNSIENSIQYLYKYYKNNSDSLIYENLLMDKYSYG
jgi:GDP-L-fucose synthase